MLNLQDKPVAVEYGDDAINWIWYGECLVYGPYLAIQPDKSYRLHKFDERQGATQHPKPKWSLDTYNGGNVTQSDHYGACLRSRDDGWKSSQQFILCDVVHGMWVPRPLADWVLESKRARVK